MGHKRKNGKRNDNMGNLVKNFDSLVAYEEFCEQILPALRKDLKNGLTDEEILAKWKPVAAARAVSLVGSLQDAVALAASKDILDRTQGKAVERRVVAHRLERLPDEQLDALLLTELSEQESQETEE
jgi:hypothetical protein